MSAYVLTLAAILTLGAAEATAAPDQGMATGKGTGVITELDAKAATVTIKHGPIPALKWPAMTMTFHAKPASLLRGLKIGEKVSFDVNAASGAPEVTAVRKQ